MNFHYSVSLDLFGGETSTNAGNYFTAGLKGRWQEERRTDDHRLTDDSASVSTVDDGEIRQLEVAALTALNDDLRGEYIRDCRGGVARWNKILDGYGVGKRLYLPHTGFNRRVGLFAGHHVAPSGEVLTEVEWQRRASGWLPTGQDKAYVRSLMKPVYERGKIAAWIAPPRQGINGKPFDYEYVHLS